MNCCGFISNVVTIKLVIKKVRRKMVIWRRKFGICLMKMDVRDEKEMSEQERRMSETLRTQCLNVVMNMSLVG